MAFEWDDDKNRANLEKHGVSFQTAARIFEGPVLTSVDARFEYGEVREISVGRIDGILFLTVAHTDRNGVTRIISARPAKRSERRCYEQAIRQGAERQGTGGSA